MRNLEKFALAILAVLFINCAESEPMDIGGGQELLSVDSPVISLLSRTTMNDGTVDNLLDQADCFTLELPVVVRIGDEEYEIKTAEDLDFLSELLSGEHNKVTVCHNTGSGFRTISINVNAVQAHLNHGDSLGACDADDNDNDDNHEDEDADDDQEDDDDDREADDHDDDDEEDDDEDHEDDDQDDDDEEDDDDDDHEDDDENDDEDDEHGDDDEDDDEDDEHGDDDDKNAGVEDYGWDYPVELVYPVTIILKDYTRITIKNEAELEAARAACEDESIPDATIDCIDLKYPITVSVFDPNRDVSDTIIFENDGEVFLFIDALKDSDIVTVQFPITLILADESEVVVDSLEMLEQLLLANSNGCDQSGA